MPDEDHGKMGRKGIHHDNIAGGDPERYGFSYKKKKTEDPEWPTLFYCLGHHKKGMALNEINASRPPYLCHRCKRKKVNTEVPIKMDERKDLIAIAINKNGIIGVLNPNEKNTTLRKLRLVRSFTSRSAKPIKFLKKEENFIINRLRKSSLPPV